MIHIFQNSIDTVLMPVNYYLSFILYFRMNLSTLPSVSIIFCEPVKNGWLPDHMSTLSCFLVEPTVIIYLPLQ